MSHMHPASRDRLYELLADEALAALDTKHEAELEALLSEAPDAQRDELMQTAALTQLAFLQRDRPAPKAMPGHLRARILGTAQAERPASKPG